MNRREVIGTLAVVGLALTAARAWAQRAGKVWRIGILETTSASLNAVNYDELRRGLRVLGYREGDNLVIEYRSADGDAARFPELAAELVRLNVDLIVTRGTPALLAAKDATGAIPIVSAASGEPVAVGAVASLSRGGGNVTGLSTFNTELEPKRLQLLKGLVQNVKRLAALYNLGNVSLVPAWETLKAGAPALGVAPVLLDVRKEEELGQAFATAAREKADAIMVGLDGLFQPHLRSIVDLAMAHKLPAIYASKEFVVAGGLMSYSASYPHLYFRAAGVIDKILRGASPGDIPTEQATTFELTINLKTARALGIATPPTLLAVADEVIE